MSKAIYWHTSDIVVVEMIVEDNGTITCQDTYKKY